MSKQSDVAAAWEVREAVLGVIGVGLVVGGTIVLTPNFPIVLGAIIKSIQEMKQFQIPKKKLKRTLQSLEKQEIITLEQKEGEVVVYLRSMFDPRVLRYSLKALLAAKHNPGAWDGSWRMVLFDVPEEQKNKRQYIRRFLRYVGFYQYQQSVYVFPYECEDAVRLIQKMVEGSAYVKYLVASKIDADQELKAYFHLK